MPPIREIFRDLLRRHDTFMARMMGEPMPEPSPPVSIEPLLAIQRTQLGLMNSTPTDMESQLARGIADRITERQDAAVMAAIVADQATAVHPAAAFMAGSGLGPFGPLLELSGFHGMRPSGLGVVVPEGGRLAVDVTAGEVSSGIPDRTSVGTTPPRNPTLGQVWVSPNDFRAMIWNGVNWIVAVLDGRPSPSTPPPPPEPPTPPPDPSKPTGRRFDL